MKISGYKTYIGAALVGISAILEVLGYAEIAKVVLTIGGTLGIVGVRHAIKKVEDAE